MKTKAEPKPTIVTLPIAAIVVDPGVQPRVKGLDAPTVAEYRERYKAADEFPPLVAYGTKKKAWLSEGFHRAEVYRLEDVTEVQVELRAGDRDDAILNALQSNKAHGLRRTNADKRAAVERALALRPTWSDRRIADFVGVSHNFVGELRAACVSSDYTSGGQTRERSDGRTFTVSPMSAAAKAADANDLRYDEPEEEAGTEDEDDDDAPDRHSVAALEQHAREAADNGDYALAAEIDEQADAIRDALERGDAAEAARVWAGDPEPEADEPTIVEDEPKPAKVVPPPAVDAWGIPIQPHAVEAFAAVPEFKRVLALLREARTALTPLCETPGGRLLLKRCQFETAKNTHGGRWVLAELSNAIGTIEDAMPRHTDCPYHFNTHQPHDAAEIGRACPICDNKRFAGDLRKRQIPAELLAAMRSHYGVAEGD